MTLRTRIATPGRRKTHYSPSIVAGFVSFLAYSSSGHAESVVFADTDFQAANWTEVVLVAGTHSFTWYVSQDTGEGTPPPSRKVVHDTTGGPTSVKLGHLRVGATYTPGTQGAIATVDYSMDAKVLDGGMSNAVGYYPYIRQGGTDFIGPFFLVLDGAGWSSFTQPGLIATDFRDVATLTMSPDFSGGGGPLEFGFTSTNGTGGTGGIHSDSRVDNWSVVVHAVIPGTGYCFGDPGVGTPCPCSNDNDGSVPGSGCANGLFTSGAQLTASGTASVTNDSLTLASAHVEPNNFGLYFQAQNALNGGNGNVFGDGLRCAGSSLIRLEIVQANAAGDSSTSVAIAVTAGNVAAGDTKFYQCWYRNPSRSPCGSDFNLTNGYEITWLP